jgi:hypothetical protein
MMNVENLYKYFWAKIGENIGNLDSRFMHTKNNIYTAFHLAQWPNVELPNVEFWTECQTSFITLVPTALC